MVGGALSASIAKALAPAPQPETVITHLPSSVPYIVNNTGNYPGIERDRFARVTFPVPSDGQSYWRVFTPTEPFGSVGPHCRVK